MLSRMLFSTQDNFFLKMTLAIQGSCAKKAMPIKDSFATSVFCTKRLALCRFLFTQDSLCGSLCPKLRRSLRVPITIYVYTHTHTHTQISTHTHEPNTSANAHPKHVHTHKHTHTHTHTEPNLPSIVRSLCQKEPYFFRAVSQKDFAIITFVCRRGIVISRGLYLQKSHTKSGLFCKTERFSRVCCFFHTG